MVLSLTIFPKASSGRQYLVPVTFLAEGAVHISRFNSFHEHYIVPWNLWSIIVATVTHCEKFLSEDKWSVPGY